MLRASAAHESGELSLPLPARSGASGRSRARHWALAALALLALAVLIATLMPATPSEAAYLKAADRARAALRYDRALAWYATASAAMPSDSAPLCLEGQVYALQQLWSAAVAADTQCVSREQARAAGWVALGEARNASGESPISAWQRAAALGSSTAWRLLAEDAESTGAFTTALAAWNHLPPDDAQALLHRGLLALELGDTPAARAAFVALRAAPSLYAETAVDNGFVLLSAGDLSDPVQQFQLGRAFLSANMPRLALAPLQRAASLLPMSGELHATLGWTLWLLGQRTQARSEIALGPQLEPTSSFVWFTTGEMALAGGNLHEARSDFQRGLTLDPRNPVLWAAQADVYTAQSDYLHAELAYTSAAQLSNDPKYTIALLRFYVDHDIGYAGSRAATAASVAVGRFPGNEPVRFLQAEILKQASQPSFAYYAAQAALRLDPTDPAPYIFLSAYAFASGDYVTAALELRTALALRPDGPLAPLARQQLAPLGDIGA